MILHPAFKTLVAQPELLAEHVGAYAQLAAAEAHQASRGLRLKGALAAGAVACAALGAGLAGVAVLVLAAIPMADMPAPWALGLAPGVPLAAGAVLWLAQRRQAVDLGFRTLRAQLHLDQVLWQRLGEE